MISEQEIQEIQENSLSTSLRFKGADFFHPGTTCMVLGCGGIGSHVAYLLNKQECALIIYDPDMVEIHNVGTQMLGGLNNVGSTKIDAYRHFILNFFEEEPANIYIPEFYDEKSLENPYVFSCFDNMKARKTAFEKWCSIEDPDKIFIDGRMLADQGMIYAIRPGMEEKYKETLFDDSEVEEGPCSNRATAFCAFFTSSMMVNIFNNFLSNKRYGDEVKVIPFGIRFVLPIMMIEEIL